ncbi:MAG: hypothetical protein N2749_06420 [Clostridia bacterium]|nr:hypothetical protein [Clostridia bacterium]
MKNVENSEYNINNLINEYKKNIYFENSNYRIYGKPILGENILIEYFGKLVDNVAIENVINNNIFIYYGFGGLWQKKNHIEMEYYNQNKKDSFFVEIPIIDKNSLYFCFMDANNNWDLNETSSYFIEVEDKTCDLSRTESQALEIEKNTSLFEKYKEIFCSNWYKLLEKIGNLFRKNL